MAKNDKQLVKDVAVDVPATPKNDSTSSKIKELYDAGVPVTEIAKQLGIRYAFAYQVSQRHAAATGKEFSTGHVKGETKSQKIRDMFDSGMTKGDIAKQLNANYTFVWMTVNAHEKAQARRAAKEAEEAAKAGNQ